MNNKYKPKFYARTQTKIDHVIKTESILEAKLCIEPHLIREEKFSVMSDDNIKQWIGTTIKEIIDQSVFGRIEKLILDEDEFLRHVDKYFLAIKQKVEIAKNANSPIIT